ncbi:MAG: VCBS repeat-containing protein [Anaerolineae bacterium]|nr:VCBS repeat-containing protein [Anaerolineae bacterium]
MRRGRRVLPIILIILSLVSGTRVGAESRAAWSAAIQEPVLKWQHGGCYSSWCETGWYSSPAVADLDGDGTMEVIAGAYKVFILNGEDGTLQRSIDTPGSRVWPGVAVADLDNDGDLEIFTAQGGGYLNVLDHAGDTVWTRQPVSNELRGLSVDDLDGDGTLEIVVTAARGDEINTWVYEHDGTLRPGWPQLDNDSGYAWGVFNDNVALGDIDGDGVGEIVVPSDVHYICAYELNGVQIPAHAMYGDKAWGKVGVHVDHWVDLRGYAHCGTEHRPNFAHTPANIADVNGDGVPEVVAMGNVYNCGTDPYTSLYEMPFIFNADRSRWSGDGFDWTAIPVPDGSADPLSEDWNVIESNMSNPVTVDLDGDRYLEILFSSYDGRVHAYWLDKAEHGNWPYDVHTGGPYSFASEPAVADLDNDGTAEVIFGSWVQKGSYQTGKLYVLDYQGNVLHEVSLPGAYDSSNWNGALAAPTLANIDADADLEVVLNTAHSGFVAYDLPGTANARVLWGTGRGNYQRTGSILYGSLRSSQVSVYPLQPGPGDTLTYTIRLENPGPTLPSVRLTSTLPAEVTYAGNLWASFGSFGEAGGVITWTGDVSTNVPVTITYGAVVSGGITSAEVLVNLVLLDDGLGNVEERYAVAIANGIAIYLPLVRRG